MNYLLPTTPQLQRKLALQRSYGEIKIERVGSFNREESYSYCRSVVNGAPSRFARYI